MALLKYFKEERIDSVLPEPDGPLAHSTPGLDIDNCIKQSKIALRYSQFLKLFF